jgi:hypothetical protein
MNSGQGSNKSKQKKIANREIYYLLLVDLSNPSESTKHRQPLNIEYTDIFEDLLSIKLPINDEKKDC